MEDSNTNKGVAIGTSTLGTGLAALIFSWPASCPGFSSGVWEPCTNVLGMSATTLNAGQSLLVGGVLGAAAGGLVDLYYRYASRATPPVA